MIAHIIDYFLWYYDDDVCAVAFRIGVHIRYQFALSLTIDGRKNKASNPFSLFDDFACLFRYFSVPFISLSPSRSSHFALYFSVFVFIVVKRDGSSWHNEKTEKKIEPISLLCCVVASVCFFSLTLALPLRHCIAMQWLWAKNDSIGNCVSVLNVIIIADITIWILVWLSGCIVVCFYTIFFSTMIFSFCCKTFCRRLKTILLFFYFFLVSIDDAPLEYDFAQGINNLPRFFLS